jgi:fatty acid desaturase
MVLTIFKAAVPVAPCTSSTITKHVQLTASSTQQQTGFDTCIDPEIKRAQDSKPLATDTLEYDAAALQRACQHIAAFSGADDLRGGLGFALTCALWVGSFLLGRWLLPQLSFNTLRGWALGGFWLLLRVGSSVRVYVQMHDLTHSSTFSKRWMNEWAAALTALMNPVDPADYKRVHSQHHAHTGMEVRRSGTW